MAKFNLRIVSPNNLILEEDVDMIIMRGVEGDIGILSGHENLTTLLTVGVLKIINDGVEREVAVLGGFAEVTPTHVTIMSDAAELAENIDINRAKESKQRAEDLINKKTSDLDIRRAELSLHRALVRIEVSEHSSKRK